MSGSLDMHFAAGESMEEPAVVEPPPEKLACILCLQDDVPLAMNPGFVDADFTQQVGYCRCDWRICKDCWHEKIGNINISFPGLNFVFDTVRQRTDVCYQCKKAFVCTSTPFDFISPCVSTVFECGKYLVEGIGLFVRMSDFLSIFKASGEHPLFNSLPIQLLSTTLIIFSYAGLEKMKGYAFAVLGAQYLGFPAVSRIFPRTKPYIDRYGDAACVSIQAVYYIGSFLWNLQWRKRVTVLKFE